MANYSKTTNFGTKDTLPTGDSQKIIRGTEFDTEFDNIATAITSKLDSPASSANVNFLQSGAAAVSRTVESKLREIISAKDFGAVGDNVTDDTTALQNFLNACKDRRGFIPAGRYKITSALVLDPQYAYNIEGEGWDPNAGALTVINNTGTGSAIQLWNSPYTTNYDSQIRLAHLTINGNASSQYGIHVIQALIFLEYVWICNHGIHGLYLQKAYGSAFRQCVIAQNYRHGCYVYQAGNALHFDHCLFNGNSRVDGYAGCQVSGSAGNENLGITFTACDFTGNGYPGGVTTAFGIAIQHTWGIALVGCYGELNKLRNVYADSSVKGLSITNSYWQDSMVELVNVVGLTYENNVHQYVTAATSATITGTTNARQMVRVHGNTFVGGATSSFSGGVKQRNESYANAAPTSGTFEAGDIVWYANPDQGTPFGWVCTAAGTPGTWRPIIDRLPGTYANWGDSDATLSALSSLGTNFWRSPLTATRAVTLSTTGAYAGAKFRIVRAAGATGAFNLNVGSGPLKALTAAGQWCDVEYDGSTWLLSAYGTL